MSPVRTVLDEFEQLTAAILDGTATAAERARFTELSRMYPEFSSIWLEQVRLHALLTCRGAGKTEGRGRGVGSRQSAVGSGGTWKRAWWKVAAAAAAAVVAATVWQTTTARRSEELASFAQATAAKGVGRLASGFRSPATGPVALVRGAGAERLELPGRLPGTVRLAAGQATVRLGSGVALTLLGPLELEVRDAMQVRLAEGRLLASVPQVASGFTVRTGELEVWDIGTVFGVSAGDGRSEVFVFKGEVQVNEASGEPVDLCGAGEGVRASGRQRPFKFAADWPEARKVLASARGASAPADPGAAFEVAGRVAEMWVRRYAPEVAPPPPPPVAGLRGGRSAVGSGQSAVGSGQWAVGSRQSAVGGKPSAAGTGTITGVAGGPPAKQEEGTVMRGMTNTAAAFAAAAVLGAAGAARAVPEVTNVRMQQREGTRVVDVWYDLAGEAAIVTLGIETNGAAIPDGAVTRLSGDVSVVIQPGTDRHIVWNAGADWPENVAESAKARVTAWSVDAPPLYCAVDVTAGTSAQSYPVYYYTSAEAVPNGVTNDLYKTLRILMRRVGPTEGAGFTMGSPGNESYRTTAREAQVQAVLTKGYYVGVYEVTQGQWQQVMGDVRSWPAKWSNNDHKLTRPVEQVSYFDIRENPANSAIAPNWPQSDAVHANSFMGRLRSKAGLAGFDLPTEAQWEYACRAGTTGALNDGTVNITNTNSDARLDLLGRYERNGGKVWNGTAWVDPATDCTTANATAAVGSYAPNAWGLYDMHGNVWEWCLDWYADAMAGGDDPVGAGSGSFRVSRGGSWYNAASYCRSAFRDRNVPSNRNSDIGFRLFRTLP